MTAGAPPVATACERCGLPLSGGDLVCPRCGALVHASRLGQLSQEATRLEAIHPLLAASVWRQALDLLPPGSPPHEWTVSRINALTGGAIGASGSSGASDSLSQGGASPTIQYSATDSSPAGANGRPVLSYRPASGDSRGETWQSALLKTGGSMLLSIWLFSRMDGWSFAVGLVLLIFVHEMGHVIANWHYGIRQTAPIFLGIFGAVIFLRGNLRNAKEEAVVGIAGPVTGTLGALACYLWFLKTGDDLAMRLAFFGCFINLWNLMPVPPLDGGHATAAITPFLWAVGLLGLVGFEILQLIGSLSSGNFSFWWLLIVFWILRSALPRVRNTLLQRGWAHPYFAVGWRWRLGMSVLYVGLAVLLLSGIFSLILKHGMGF